MADQIPYSIAEQLLTKLGSHVFQEIAMVYGVEDDLKKLRDSLSSVNAVLLDAEEKQEKNHAVQDWVRRLKEIVYDADDLFDDFATKDLRKKALGPRNMGRKVRDFFSSSNQIWCRYKVGHGIQDIRARLYDVKNDIVGLNFVEKQIIVNERSKDSHRETDSYVRQSEIIGREEDTNTIIESLMLNLGNQQADISVLAVVGFGGLGKTALAQLVYNDEKVDKHFDVRMWVCVSENFDVKLIIKKMLRCIVTELDENLDLEQLQREVGKNLGGKRYLLVLDDVWSEDWQKWDNLRKYLLVGASGSKIIVTTRSKKVASVMGDESPYELQGLIEEKAWNLFEKLAFGERASGVNPKVMKIGREIVKKCKGVPLVIRTLGSFMQSKTRENEWLSVLENDLWRSCESRGDFIPLLKLSYDHLPTHLRQCFAFCAMFPKDYEFDKEKLIYTWMSQGYIVASSNSNECLEEIGEEYLNELLFRSLFQISRDQYGREFYRMHDLIHDLAHSIAKDGCIVVEEKNIEKISERVQHVYWLPSEDPFRSLIKAEGLRTLICQVDQNRHLNRITSNCQRLRALQCSWSSNDVVVSSIRKLKHLRYLDLSESRVERLPDSITKLLNLQTLIFTSSFHLLELPTDIQNLISLRCLLIDGCYALQGMPIGLGKLTGLHRLSHFIVGKSSNGQAELNELEPLNQLRGRLVIAGLKNVRSCESESKKVNLLAKEHLQCLDLNWAEEGKGPLEKEIKSAEEETELEMLFDKLQPHPNLQELYVMSYQGVRFSGWLPRILNLVQLKLHLCPYLKQIPPLDQLPSLKTLWIWWLEALEYISDEYEVKESSFVSEDESCSLSEDESSGAIFPSLQDIDIGFCFNLKGWWRKWRRNQFPRLSRLYITECKGLTSLQELGMHQLTALQELKLTNCPKLDERCEKEKGVDWPIISHIPKFIIAKSVYDS